MKNIILLATFFTSSFATFSQSQERILQKQSANLKEPSVAALLLYNKGVDYSDKKEYALGIKNYEMAVALDSDYVDAYNNLGLNFYEMNLLDSASFYLRISLRKLPSGTTAMQNLGLVEEKAGDLPKALDLYKQIISVDPQSPEGYYNASRALLTMGKLEEGLAQALQAEKIYTKLKSPGLSDCHYLIFVAYYNLQNKPMAKKYLTLCKNENVQIPAEMEKGLQ
jgi:tetratricopeptide (TPR) repeat protein